MQHIPAQGRDPAIVKLDQEGLPTFESSFGGLSGVKLRVHRLFGGVTEVADLVSPWPLRMKCTATGETLLIQEDTPVDEIGKHVQALNQALIGVCRWSPLLLVSSCNSMLLNTLKAMLRSPALIAQILWSVLKLSAIC